MSTNQPGDLYIFRCHVIQLSLHQATSTVCELGYRIHAPPNEHIRIRLKHQPMCNVCDTKAFDTIPGRLGETRGAAG